MRKAMLTAAAAAALLVVSAPFAAYAVDEVTEPTTPAAAEYPPDRPTQPSLAGSSVSPSCVSDVPWISFEVSLTDPEGLSEGSFARLVLTDGTNTETVDLGDLGDDNYLKGSVLWPGAKVENGVATGWPGWTQNASGEWVETLENYAWTRGPITAKIEVNPSIDVELSYPPATIACANPPGELPLTGAGALPATGVSAYVVPLGVAGGIAAIAGAVLLFARRRTQG